MAPHLEMLSVAVRNADTHAAHWISLLLKQAPLLTKLHWQGPAITAMWDQLTHFSWNHLRLRFHDNDWLFTSLATIHLLPTVTTFSFSGEQALLNFITLPNLTHLIIERTKRSDVWAAPPMDLSLLLSRSVCAITCLELWEHQFPSARPDLLKHSAITNSLRRLSISSYDMNQFFVFLERAVPGTLHHRLLLLRDIDRCFKIDTLSCCRQVDETSGLLAALIRVQLPMLESLCLLDNSPADADLELRAVLTGSSPLVVLQSAPLRREYEMWWNFAEGATFVKALAVADTEALRKFDLNWEFILERKWQPRKEGGNIFSPSSWAD
ncbi:hypothetical protein B0H19DRAFT_1381698 [Mycena capillaripes]|nr:hypothetical protein B0H19DRAFT_1381698 [Mycena capillaripes]